MSEIIVSRIDPSDVTLELTSHFQILARTGWRLSLPHRTDAERIQQFNPDSADHLRSTQKIYKRYARRTRGGLFAAYDTASIKDSGDPVGFALAGEEVSGSRLQQLHKRLWHSEKVYAHLRHVCAEKLRQGIGSQLVSAALESFRSEQIPTVYIFDENEVALRAFEKWGFRLDPNPQDAKVLPNYFGAGDPVLQRRYAADSVRAVIETIQPAKND